MARLILVHGAAHGAWCWRRVMPLLEARGHVVLACDLPGAGEDPAEPGDVTLDDYRQRVLGLLDAGTAPAVLVGHSMGGVTVGAVCEARPERVLGAVYVTAFMLRDGECARDVTLLEPQPAVIDAIDFAADATGRCYVYRASRAAELFYADCDAADAAEAAARLRPMPRVIARTPQTLTAERGGRVPRVYLQCLADRAIPLSLQERMCERRPPSRVHRLPCGHSPFLARPALLAALLDEAARAFEAPVPDA